MFSLINIHNIHEWICGARQRIPTATIPDGIIFKVARYLFMNLHINRIIHLVVFTVYWGALIRMSNSVMHLFMGMCLGLTIH